VPYWRFWTREHQQTILEKVSAKLSNRALVAYACAAFHEARSLFHHIEHNELVQNSTFIRALKLQGHLCWAYDSPGTRGVALSEPTIVDDESLLLQLRRVAEQVEKDPTITHKDPLDNLIWLARRIVETCKEEHDSVSTGKGNGNPRVQEVLRQTFQLEQELAQISDAQLREVVRSFAQVQIFCDIFQLFWGVIA
jgi:hypothetical protein